MSASSTRVFRSVLLFTSILMLSNVAAKPPNILVLVADDLGTEVLSSYGIGSPTAVTPNLDILAEEGVRFEGFWSQPSCTPARAAIMTGRYAFRSGVNHALLYQWAKLDAPEPVIPASANKEIFYTRGRATNGAAYVTKAPPPDDELPRGPSREELMLPAALKSLPSGYSTGAVGKWHLADLMNGSLNHPNDSGFDYFSGALFGGPSAYSAWRHIENGKLTAEAGYIDVRAATDAVSWINQQGNRPWFLWFSFSNPHTPIHLPPADLLHSKAKELNPDPTGDNNQAYFLAQVEAMDTLVGKVLNGIPEDVLSNTYIIFLGDNGTDRIVQPPAPRDPRRVKGTVYEGGVNVPLIIKGPGIDSGRVEHRLAHVVDLFATIIELAGGKVSDLALENRALDSVSLVPYLFDEHSPSQRTWVLAEGAKGQAIRNGAYKLVVLNGDEELYHLATDPNELEPLAIGSLNNEAHASYVALKQRMNELYVSQPK